MHLIRYTALITILWGSFVYCANQTETLSPVLPNKKLPFTVRIEQLDFSLPVGIHSGATAIHDGKWLLITGRAGGLHGFSNTPTNFPPDEQNKVVYVVDPVKKTVKSRSLTDPYSGLTPQQIDTLSVTSPQSYQKKNTLYITGGYGVDTATGLFSTKDTLTAINVPGLMHWVENPSYHKKASRYIRQIHHPIFQVTGGYMDQSEDEPTLLVFGQNFQGFYFDSSNGAYTQLIRRFRIIDDGKKLSIKIKPSKPSRPDPNFRRRDLNVVPVVTKKHHKLIPSFVALSGVFTPTDGIWTVPVTLNNHGHPKMAKPTDPKTFKQGMNSYLCPTLRMFSKKHNDMYIVLFGGLEYEYFSDGQFHVNSEIPFSNNVTTIKINRKGKFTQYLMDNEYPEIFSTQSNPGNQLLFGAGANFMPTEHIPMYSDGNVNRYSSGIVKLDHIKKKPVLVGYIMGGIQSTLPNTNSRLDSAASPYIFKVFVVPTE